MKAKWATVAFCFALLVGMWIGTLRVPETIISERVDRVNYLNLRAKDLRHNLEVVANTLNLTVRPIDELQTIADRHRQNRHEIEDLHRRNKIEVEDMRRNIYREAEKLEHHSWTLGYKEGYNNARAR